jgi:hypothetical protein
VDAVDPFGPGLLRMLQRDFQNVLGNAQFVHGIFAATTLARESFPRYRKFFMILPWKALLPLE